MRILFALACLLLALPSHAAAPPLPAEPGKRIGLVLGGGGARGFAHVGVIQVLEENRIPVHAISGTSMGAVVGSLYAKGENSDRLAEITREIDWTTIFDDTIPRERMSFRRKRDQRDVLVDFRIGFSNGGIALPQGVLRGQDLYLTLAQYLSLARGTADFDDLAIPFRAVATDIVTTERIVMGSGDIATAVFASMSVPGGLPPVERDGRLLVDGMLVDNVPIDVAREMGVDTVIVVNVSSPLRTKEEITNFVSIINQMQLMLGRDAVERQLKTLSGRDVLILPENTDIGSTNFEKSEEGIAFGRAAALAVLDQLRPLALSEADWNAYLAARAARAPDHAPSIEFVKLDNRSDVSDDTIKALVSAKPGKPLDSAQMAKDLQNVYGLGEFRAVRYSVGPGEGQPGEGVTILAVGDPTSANWLQLGLGIATDFNRSTNLRIGLAYTDRNFLGTGAEWRTDVRVGNDLLLETSLYRQFGRNFVEVTPFWTRKDSLVFNDSTQIAEVRLERLGARVAGGWLLGNWGEIRLGVESATVRLDDLVGSTDLPGERLQDSSVGAQFTVDRVDNLNYPTVGHLAIVSFTQHVGLLGGDFDFSVFEARGYKPFTFGRTTLNLGAEAGITSEGDGRTLGNFRLGGFLSLSGLQPDQLLGRHKLLGRAILYHRLSEAAPIVDLPIFVGGSLELGNAWTALDDVGFDDLRPAGSLFISAETPFGPMTLAAGAARGGSSLYLLIGRIF